MLGALARSLFGTANDRIVKGFDKPVAKINALEPEFSKLSDDALRAKTIEFRERLAKGDTLDDAAGRSLRHGARGSSRHAGPAPLRRPAGAAWCCTTARSPK
jgi:preprotein translocase subunit SecA